MVIVLKLDIGLRVAIWRSYKDNRPIDGDDILVRNQTNEKIGGQTISE
jgi:hypothetical protein